MVEWLAIIVGAYLLIASWWMYLVNNAPYVPCPVCNDLGEHPREPVCTCVDGRAWLTHPTKPGEYVGAQCPKCCAALLAKELSEVRETIR